MAKVMITESYLEDIADAIREKKGGSNTYTPGEMAAAISSIDSGGHLTQDQDGFLVIPPTGGGSGGGALSTANVRIYNVVQNSYWWLGGTIYQGDYTYVTGGLLDGSNFVTEGSYEFDKQDFDETYTFAFYTSTQIWIDGSNSNMVATGGCSIEYDNDEGAWIATISGDGTIHG